MHSEAIDSGMPLKQETELFDLFNHITTIDGFSFLVQNAPTSAQADQWNRNKTDFVRHNFDMQWAVVERAGIPETDRAFRKVWKRDCTQIARFVASRIGDLKELSLSDQAYISIFLHHVFTSNPPSFVPISIPDKARRQELTLAVGNLTKTSPPQVIQSLYELFSNLKEPQRKVEYPPVIKSNAEIIDPKEDILPEGEPPWITGEVPTNSPWAELETGELEYPAKATHYSCMDFIYSNLPEEGSYPRPYFFGRTEVDLVDNSKDETGINSVRLRRRTLRNGVAFIYPTITDYRGITKEVAPSGQSIRRYHHNSGQYEEERDRGRYIQYSVEANKDTKSRFLDIVRQRNTNTPQQHNTVYVLRKPDWLYVNQSSWKKTKPGQILLSFECETQTAPTIGNFEMNLDCIEPGSDKNTRLILRTRDLENHWYPTIELHISGRSEYIPAVPGKQELDTRIDHKLIIKWNKDGKKVEAELVRSKWQGSKGYYILECGDESFETSVPERFNHPVNIETLVKNACQSVISQGDIRPEELIEQSFDGGVIGSDWQGKFDE